MHANENRLFAVVEHQQGCFTSSQAVVCGYPTSNHGYHVRSGTWARVGRGIYRLNRFPFAPEHQYVLWSLWSRDRTGKPQGVFSHQTALSIHELSDVMPSKLHLTVPVRFRRRAALPGIICLHKTDLSDIEIEARQGYRVVRPMHAIAELLRDGTESRDHLRQALRQGLDRGLIAQRELRRHPERIALQALLDGSPA